MKKDHVLEQGFTLIEIIIVLVLLGILAATAVPKYFDLQKTARVRAAQAAVTEVQSRMNLIFADNLLKGETCVGALGKLTTELFSGGSVKIGDKWTVTGEVAAVADKGTSTKVTISGISDGIKFDDTEMKMLAVMMNKTNTDATFTFDSPSCDTTAVPKANSKDNS